VLPCLTEPLKGHIEDDDDAGTWTDEGCMTGPALEGGVSAVKLTQVSCTGGGSGGGGGGGGEWDDHIPSADTGPAGKERRGGLFLFHTRD